MQCQNCHYENDESLLYCGQCGAKLEAPVAPQTEKSFISRNMFAIWSLALGIGCLFFLLYVTYISFSGLGQLHFDRDFVFFFAWFGMLAILFPCETFGIIGLVKAKTYPNSNGTLLSIAGIITGAIAIFSFVILSARVL